MRQQPAVLVIAGTDSSGGAGLSRDLRVLADHKVHAIPVVTAVTAQTNASVHGIWTVPPAIIRQQLRTALDTVSFGAVKIGMLGSRDTVETIAAGIPAREEVPIVLDPVLAASSGGELLDTAGAEALRALLLPKVTLLTPNIPEAAALLSERAATDEHTLIKQAERLLRTGPRAVLIKGGHATGPECADLLVTYDGEIVRLTLARSATTARGTGCALSSAIAAGLARGLALADACRLAKRYVVEELLARSDPRD